MSRENNHRLHQQCQCILDIDQLKTILCEIFITMAFHRKVNERSHPCSLFATLNEGWVKR